jgi:hypothetical protein
LNASFATPFAGQVNGENVSYANKPAVPSKGFLEKEKVLLIRNKPSADDMSEKPAMPLPETVLRVAEQRDVEVVELGNVLVRLNNIDHLFEK